MPTMQKEASLTNLARSQPSSSKSSKYSCLQPLLPHWSVAYMLKIYDVGCHIFTTNVEILLEIIIATNLCIFLQEGTICTTVISENNDTHDQTSLLYQIT